MAFNKFRRFPVKWIGQKRKNERCRRLFGGSQRERRVVQVKGCSPERHLGSNCTGGLHGRCRCTIIRSLAQAPAASDEGSRPVPAAQFPAAPAAGITCSVDSALPFRIFTVFFFSSSSAAFSLWNSWAARLGSFFIEFILFKRIHFDSVVFARCNNNNRADRVTWSGASLWCEHLWFWLSTKVEHSGGMVLQKLWIYSSWSDRTSKSKWVTSFDRVTGFFFKNYVYKIMYTYM